MLLLFVGIFLVLIIVFKIINHYDSFWKHIMAIPGPIGLPLIGTAYYFDSPENVFNRDRHLAKKYYPIYKKYSYNLALVNIMHPEDIQPILSDFKHNAKSIFYNLLHDWIGLGILTSKDDMWHRRRKLLTPAFHFNILGHFLEIFNKETVHFVEYIKKECQKPYIDIIKPVTEFTLMSIGESSFGKDLRDDPDCEEYVQAVHDYGEHFIHRIVRPWLLIPCLYKFSSFSKKHDATLKILHNFSEKVIREREEFYRNETIGNINKKQQILLDLMLEAKYTGSHIDDSGIKDETNGFIFGGHDTTGVGLCHCLLLLANEPNIQEEIYEIIQSVCQNPNSPTLSDLADMEFLDRCIKECLRIFPSISAISRVAGEEMKTKTGYTIPKGSNIRILIYDLHRDPKIWENPEKFDPDRFLPENVAKRHHFSYLPFSAGRRNCIGQKYAIIELKAALCGIINNFKMIAITKPDDMRHKADIVLRPACEIRIKFIARNEIIS